MSGHAANAGPLVLTGTLLVGMLGRGCYTRRAHGLVAGSPGERQGGAVHTTANVSCGFLPTPVQELHTADRQHLLIRKEKKVLARARDGAAANPGHGALPSHPYPQPLAHIRTHKLFRHGHHDSARPPPRPMKMATCRHSNNGEHLTAEETGGPHTATASKERAAVPAHSPPAAQPENGG